MKVLYFDPIVGVSGDMILAALIDLGVPVDHVRKKLRCIGNFELIVSRVKQQGVSARSVHFKIKKPIKVERFIPVITKSTLPSGVKSQAITIIQRIFDVERKVHRIKHLHLHELADTDTLLDITSALVAIDYLKVCKIYSRAAKVGQGFIKTVEGNMPAFNFATAELLRDFPVHILPISAELTTPTGAAILSTIAEPRAEIVLSKIKGIGLGAGAMHIKGYSNLLRVFKAEVADILTDECIVIETNIDDMSPQDYEVLFEYLYEAGALEVFLTPVIMKHSRPGILLTVLCPTYSDKIINVIFNQTTTIGLRIRHTKRLKLKRSISKISSPYGPVRIKIIEYDGKKRISLEYQDIKKIALKKKIPLSKVRAQLTKFVDKKMPS
ncbi:hypothetical protein AMJ52_01430 [candidate division TA06 bacterium DG_78]|uniref:Nickel insertion protein n=1 Tax=candidate division TA06 bacterium DG_78 TaxID=1703772 RepID=A0A0S7YHT2_UNCT6|nr:MAG: hypothetical protein AMJ52_01430 [candidate division TA06 bacterium DG_78]